MSLASVMIRCKLWLLTQSLKYNNLLSLFR